MEDRLKAFRPTDHIVLRGEELMSPEDVCRLVGTALGAEFSLKQVSRLGNMKLLPYVLFKRRRFYRRADVETMLLRGDFIVSPTDPTTARLARPERRARHRVPGKPGRNGATTAK